jgi:hypothetical protein
VENVFRQQLCVWETTSRIAMMDLIVKQTTAHARVAVATRRMHAPYAPALQVAVGLLSPSTVGLADDHWTPRVSSLFCAHLPPTVQRPQSSASRRRQVALSAHSMTSKTARDRLQLLLVESSEAVARCDVLWAHQTVMNFTVERWIEMELLRLA